ncbi:MAG: hypothetical protein IID34_18405 [Planctomycetes bacterium]|nr:hypothetical protein [Planctomycetota bacterium]
MGIPPIGSVLTVPVASAIRAAGIVHPFGSAGKLRAGVSGLFLKVQAEVARSTIGLAPRRETRSALRQRLRAEIEAKRIIRQARREEAAIRKSVREELREEAAIEHSREGRIRMAYSAAELHELLQTAMRLNIQI